MHFKEIESIEDIREKIQILNLMQANGKEPIYDYNKARERAEELI